MENETVESKKCKNCLKRVVLEYSKCPFCRKDDFIFDGVFIQQKKPSRIHFLEWLTSLFR